MKIARWLKYLVSSAGQCLPGHKSCFVIGIVVGGIVYADKDSPKSSQVHEITSSTEIEDIEVGDVEYHYEGMSRPDPFIPPLLSTLVAKEEVKITSPLQKYSLVDLRLVGVWLLGNDSRKALVMTPRQEGVVVTSGSPLGSRGGKVLSIADKYLVVRQFSLAADGSRQYQDYRLWLEGSQPKPAALNIIRSSKLGLPNQFGYGTKNYLDTANFDHKRQKLIEELKTSKPFDDKPINVGTSGSSRDSTGNATIDAGQDKTVSTPLEPSFDASDGEVK